MALLPSSVHAQRPVLFTVTASITVFRGPSADQLVVGYLEPGMPARVFECGADCVWLNIGPSVWIHSSDVVTDGPLPQGYALPTTETAAPAATQNQPELAQPEQATTVTPTATLSTLPTATSMPSATWTSSWGQIT
jgi:hypothetical protein